MKNLLFLSLLALFFSPSLAFVNTHFDSFALYAADEIEVPPADDGDVEFPPAGDGDVETVAGISNPISANDIQDLLAVILSAIVQIAIPFLVLAVMWVGFLFVAARGNPEKLSKAKQALWYTLLGSLIILGAQTLSVILSGTIRQLTE